MFSERAAEDGDRDVLFALHEASMRPCVEATYGPWDDAFQRALFDQCWPRDRQHIRVLVENGEVIGWVRALRLGSELHIGQIEVHPSRQGQGIGTTILNRVLAVARAERKAVSLSVMKANVRARSLYERLGFYAVGETKTHVEMIAT